MAMDLNPWQPLHVLTAVLFLSLALITATTAFNFYNDWKQKQLLQALPVAELKNNDWKEALLRASAQVSTEPGRVWSLKLRESNVAIPEIKYPNSPFILHTGSRPRVVLPNTVMDEIRLLPESQVSLRKDLYKKMHGRWTEVGTEHKAGIDAIRGELTGNIAQLLPEMQDEVSYALDREIGRCPEWKRIALFPHLLQLSALTNGRFFVGPLCRNQDWTNLSLSYSLDIMGSVKTLQSYRKIERPFVAPFFAAVAEVGRAQGPGGQDAATLRRSCP